MAARSDRARAGAMEQWVFSSILLLVASLLAVIIFVGWERLFAPILGDGVWLLAAAITVLAGLVAFLIGMLWDRDAAEVEAEGRKPRYGWLAIYPAFFVISALGVINVAFYYLEGSQVLKQNIDEALQSYSALTSIAQIELRNVPHEEKVDRVRQLITALTQEIESPNGYCGVGPHARSIIADIQKDLPAFREFFGNGASASRGSRHRPVRAILDCRSAHLVALAKAYQDEAEAQLAIDPDFARDNGPEKERYLAKLDADATKASADLKVKRDAIDASTVATVADAYAIAKSAMEEAGLPYRDDRQRLDVLTGRAHPSLPLAIDLTASQQLGSITTILPSLARRIGHFTTWAYFLIAVLMDLAVIALLKSVLSLHRRRARIGTGTGRDPVNPTTGLAPRFLWVNPY